MPKFKCTVEARGYFYVEAEDMYLADKIASGMSREEIRTAVSDEGGWQDFEVNEENYPEEY